MLTVTTIELARDKIKELGFSDEDRGALVAILLSLDKDDRFVLFADTDGVVKASLQTLLNKRAAPAPAPAPVAVPVAVPNFRPVGPPPPSFYQAFPQQQQQQQQQMPYGLPHHQMPYVVAQPPNLAV